MYTTLKYIRLPVGTLKQQKANFSYFGRAASGPPPTSFEIGQWRAEAPIWLWWFASLRLPPFFAHSIRLTCVSLMNEPPNEWTAAYLFV